jgi:K+-sensing histidine kinase KdpD
MRARQIAAASTIPAGLSAAPPMIENRGGVQPLASDLKGYAWAVGVVGGATAIGWPLYHGLHWPDDARRPLLANTNVLMLYLLGVLWVATRHGRGASVLASVLGVAAFDLCFVPPYLTFNVADEQYLITFAVMLLTALVISTLTHRVRTHSLAARVAWERAEAEFLRNTLLSGVSHDLRTPLAAITGAASTVIEAGDGLTAGARAEMLETIYTEAERMERLITNLLDMTRLESGGLALRREWQPVSEVVGSALNHVERRLGGREVRTDVPADLPLVYVDAVAIEQVLVNLVDNAVEHTPAGGPVEVAARAVGAGVELEVADRGPGLPAGAEARVFEKFFRARAGAGAGGSGRGIGLGLAICKGIVEAHGGRMSAENRAGGGAVFRITLPRTGTPPQVDGTA